MTKTVFTPKNCAVLEETADKIRVGRCWLETTIDALGMVMSRRSRNATSNLVDCYVESGRLLRRIWSTATSNLVD